MATNMGNMDKWKQYMKVQGYKPAEHKYDENSLEEYITKLPDYLYKNLFIQPADVTKKIAGAVKNKIWG